jgi:hypothetical protein
VNVNDHMCKRQSALKTLISRGKSQGYLLRAEVIAMLSTVIAEDQLDDVVAMFDDMGISVFNDLPTAAELVARKTQSETPATTPPVSSPPLVGPPIAPPLVALSVAGEGGSLKLIAQQMTIGWRYRYSLLDQTYLWLDEGDAEIRRQSAWVYGWPDALAALDKYPWAALHPLQVNAQFAGRVLEAARERLTTENGSIRYRERLSDWAKLCHS